MEIYQKIVTVVMLLFSLFIFSCKSIQHDPFQEIKLPLHAEGYEIKEGYDNVSKCKYLIYNVKTKFPSKNIVDYLVGEFKKMNIKEYASDGQGAMQWEAFDKKTGNWEKTNAVPARYTATWTDLKKEKLFLLQLYYRYSEKESDWENTLHVDCKVCKYFKEYESADPPKDRE